MRRSWWLGCFALCVVLQWSLGGFAQKADTSAQDKTQTSSGQTDSSVAQDADSDADSSAKKPSATDDKAANRDRQEEMSSSKDTRVDLSPPAGDEKKHPQSGTAVMDAEDSNIDVQEFHAWDPHKAAKDIEVADFYYKRKNYRAALDRYKEALYYKPNDAVATFKLAECQDKTGDSAEAATNYQAYLKILPHGPFAADAQKALERLKADAK